MPTDILRIATLIVGGAALGVTVSAVAFSTLPLWLGAGCAIAIGICIASAI